MTGLTTPPLNLLGHLANDPARLGWPPTLPFELAMRERPVEEVCTAYGITRTMWRELRAHPEFQADLQRALDELKKEGATFRVKARLQAEELLKKSWEWQHAPHDVVPPAVKADLFKFTVRAAGLDYSREQAAQTAVGTALQINIDLSGVGKEK